MIYGLKPLVGYNLYVGRVSKGDLLQGAIDTGVDVFRAPDNSLCVKEDDYPTISRAAFRVHLRNEYGARVGVQTYGDGESWRSIVSIPRTSKDRLRDVLALVVRPIGYGGPGRPFANAPIIRRTKGHVYILQSGGLDV